MTPLFVLFACIFAFCNAAPEFRKIQTQIVSANETEFLRDHPGVKLIPLEKTVLRDGDDYKLRYTLGKAGDPLVAWGNLHETLPDREDVSVYVNYPGDTGLTQTITYIEADAVQDSPRGKLYLTQGQLGDLSIQVTVLCNSVSQYNVTINLYGH